MRRLSLFLLLAVLVPGASHRAQTPSVAGVVRDSAGRPIASAEVNAAAKLTRTDSVGRFYLSFTPRDSVTVAIRRMGYARVTFTLSSEQATHNDLDVVMNALPFALPEVRVDESGFRGMTQLAAFDQRRAQGMGVFVTSADIAARNAYQLSDVLRTQRGVIVTKRGLGGTAVYFAHGRSRRCAPSMWLDGQRAPGLEIDAIPATDVEGVELYQSIATTPAEFLRGGGMVECGTIVIWTKRPILLKR